MLLLELGGLELKVTTTAVRHKYLVAPNWLAKASLKTLLMIRLLPLVESGNTLGMWINTSDGVADYSNVFWRNFYMDGRTYMNVHTKKYNSIHGMELILRSSQFNY